MTRRLAIWLVGLLALLCAAPSIAAEAPRDEHFRYILWDSHRFGRTQADCERDMRWYRDLGFTHTYLGNAGVDEAPSPERARGLLDAADRCGMFVGLRYHFLSDADALGKALGMTRAQMIESGVLLCRKTSGSHAPCNPLHPAVIHYYRDGFARTLDAWLKYDTGRRMRLFLIGTERVFSFPRNAQDAYPAAAALLFRAAREDGVLKPGEPDGLDALRGWWNGAHEHGERWRLQKAIEDAFLERIPAADFMVDPIWAVKIVHGFGGTWTYIDNDPKRIAEGVLRLKAVTRPSPAAHSTQLIRGASHDVLLEANLLALCVGADMLYHWGVNTIEPGREASPAYGKKGWQPSPSGFPAFQHSHVADWTEFIKALYTKRKTAPGGRVWDALDGATRRRIERAMILIGEEPPGDTVREATIKALNAALKAARIYDEGAFAKLRLSARVQELAARRADLTDEDRAELNRLLIEAVYPETLRQTPQPNIRELREDVRRKRASKEPALRATGRLLRDRGELFRAWKPLAPRLALLSGIYSHSDLNFALMVGHVPFDIRRDRKDRLRGLAESRFAALTSASVSPEEYDALIKIDAAGGTVFVPRDFAPPAGKPALTRAVTWSPLDKKSQAGRYRKNPAQWREYLHTNARALRGVLHQAGFMPYFDSDNLDIVICGYRFGGQPVLFVVNDKRTVPEPGITVESQGVPVDVDILVRDRRDGLRVISIDTGADVRLARKDDGWHITDTIEPAWYRLYAVLEPGETWQGPPPLPAGPAVLDLKATPEPGGVRLSWRLPFTDWVGCDVERYRIYRAQTGAAPALLADVEGRILTGPGGVVTTWLDLTAPPGKPWTYRVRTVTPLRREGPLSAPAQVR